MKPSNRGKNICKELKSIRKRIAEDIKKQLAGDEAYRFQIDAKEANMQQIKDVAMPEAFIRRLIKEKNKEMNDETLDKEFPGVIEMLKWQIVEDRISVAHELKVTEEDLQAQAREFVRMQLRQYGIANADDKMVAEFAVETLKRKEDRERIAERAKDIKIFDGEINGDYYYTNIAHYILPGNPNEVGFAKYHVILQKKNNKWTLAAAPNFLFTKHNTEKIPTNILEAANNYTHWE